MYMYIYTFNVRDPTALIRTAVQACCLLTLTYSSESDLR